MTEAPERIWAWWFRKEHCSQDMQGGWSHLPDKKEQPYIHLDAHEAAVAAARAEAINRLLDLIGTVEGRGAANIRLAARKLRSQFIAEASK